MIFIVTSKWSRGVADLLPLGYGNRIIGQKDFIFFRLGGHPWYSGRALDCWPTGPPIDLAPGACFIT